ncbi:MAG TPA: bifunctional DNA-formamidopyrimidine glycosylase/DNA-(apurinic or apyrimidinic site) lyase [Solirubrobacteraceae bacterium]|nr:bifunctional DNA-formamidopyrimidine glycosylase/DNA-(apurinic or apyrimidinic site) lyase [Solirubrobacteraceae bacterium]
MPELPEVEAARRGLAATVIGQRIEAVEITSPRSFAVPSRAVGGLLVGHRIDRVRRRGKLLIVDLDSRAHLLIHLMMTGQLVVVEGGRTLFAGGHPSRSLLEPMPNQTTRALLRLDGDLLLYFNDPRKLGRIRLVGSSALATDPFLCTLGPEPLEDAFTLAGYRAQLLRHARAPVKAVILNQSVVAGIGNIYADESLHLARLHPACRAGSLTAAQSRRLHAAIRSVLRHGIECGGTTVAASRSRPRRATGYLEHARVFAREGQPCPLCGAPIERLHVAGRTSRICPHCQPACSPAGAELPRGS